MSAIAVLFDTNDISQSPVASRGDAELMERVGSRDTAAFEALYTALYPRLYRFIYRMTRHPDLTEELVNETMLVVWEKPQGFNYRCKVSTWVFGIAYRKALKSLSKGAQAAAELSIDELAEVIPDGKPSAVSQVELDDLIAVALDTLSPEQQAVVELTYHHELPYQEIAEILGCPENTVKTRMFYARKKLQPFFKDLISDPQDYRYEEKP
ncbi:RNA polymerase sigma factor [Methylococcus sp. EFPC2]|uniref:RNA polymerase sigma factor n=1 Tax=Methylococcus sp. EFPC2 TaxID=2812648 RepID=UPI0019689A62|nr:RNA polymerase sigma factor [Methylococcus sp. EFPC2]QSA97984.1 RNA polymerase sigma factor [Methylococcus sp. EFPC2]